MIIFTHQLHTTSAFIVWHFFYVRYNLPWWSAIIFIIGGLFPDTDIQYSKIGKIIPLWLVFEHRGFMHTLCPILIIYLLGIYLYYDSMNYQAELLISLYTFLGGYLVHLIGDTCTHSGIKWLWPIYKKPLSLHLCRTGKEIEGIAFLLSILYISVKILGFPLA